MFLNHNHRRRPNLYLFNFNDATFCESINYVAFLKTLNDRKQIDRITSIRLATGEILMLYLVINW